jgi:hypothetical protein
LVLGLFFPADVLKSGIDFIESPPQGLQLNGSPLYIKIATEIPVMDRFHELLDLILGLLVKMIEIDQLGENNRQHYDKVNVPAFHYDNRCKHQSEK